MSKLTVDQPRHIRKGEELDVDALTSYLQEHLPDLHIPLKVEQFPSGHSNLTYAVTTGDQAWVLRRPPFGAKKIKKGHDMGREFRIFTKLKPVYDKVPAPILFCEDESVIGAEFYLMERIQGIILRTTMPEGEGPDAATMTRISHAAIDGLVELHKVDWKAAGLDEMGRPEGYVARQIAGWTKRYQHAKTDDVPSMEKVAAWLIDNQPTEAGATLIHNDYKYDNIVLDPNDLSRMIAVLDWEMATIGDPLMDLGCTLGYWIDSNDPEELQMLPFSLTAQPGNLQRGEVVQHYAAQSGRDVSNILYYYAYGVFKIAVICQQIYYRYKQGDTKDPRFAHFDYIVDLFGRTAHAAIQRGSI